MTKILVPVDGSEHGYRAAGWAATLAFELGATLTLLYVHDMPSAEVMGLASKTREEIAVIEHDHAQPIFDEAVDHMDTLGDVVAILDETLVVIGEPQEEIVGVVAQKGFDHVVIGSRGLSPLSELLLGSVSESVIRKAPCPVTVIR